MGIKNTKFGTIKEIPDKNEKKKIQIMVVIKRNLV